MQNTSHASRHSDFPSARRDSFPHACGTDHWALTTKDMDVLALSLRRKLCYPPSLKAPHFSDAWD